MKVEKAGILASGELHRRWGLIDRDVSYIAGQTSAEPALSVGAALSGSLALTGSASHGVTLFRGMSLNPGSIIPDHPSVRVVSSGMLGSNQELWGRGQLDVIPESVNRMPGLMRSGVIGNDVTLVRATRLPDGSFSTGLVNDYLTAAVETAGRIVVELHEGLPTLPGAVTIPADRVDSVIAGDGRMPQLNPSPVSVVDLSVAVHTAAVVRDGDCIEIGVGSLGSAVARELARTKRDLGIHTGLITDEVLALIDSSAVTNSRKAIHRGVSVTAVVAGTDAMYRKLAGRTDILLLPVDESNDPHVMGDIAGFTAINSCLEVDLLGQINAESIGGHRRSFVGGQLDFVQGANRSKGGKVIAILRSTARGGSVSCIVPSLADATSTVGSSLVDFVVTEHGAADLRGSTLTERARRIAAIAHPDFRPGLYAAIESDLRIVPASTVDA